MIFSKIQKKYNVIVSGDPGFTLMETLVAITIFTILMIGVSVLFKAVYSDSGQQNLALNALDQARIAEFTFVNELRNATTGVDGSFPIAEASSSEIIFYSNYNLGSSVINRIRYFVSSSTLYKGVTSPSGTPLIYDLSGEKVTAIQSGFMNAGAPVFKYYDGNYAGTTTPLSQPINLNQVKFVQISLIVLNQTTRSATSTFPVSAGAAIRNLKTNLGN